MVNSMKTCDAKIYICGWTRIEEQVKEMKWQEMYKELIALRGGHLLLNQNGEFVDCSAKASLSLAQLEICKC